MESGAMLLMLEIKDLVQNLEHILHGMGRNLSCPVHKWWCYSSWQEEMLMSIICVFWIISSSTSWFDPWIMKHNEEPLKVHVWSIMADFRQRNSQAAAMTSESWRISSARECWSWILFLTKMDLWHSEGQAWVVIDQKPSLYKMLLQCSWFFKVHALNLQNLFITNNHYLQQ